MKKSLKKSYNDLFDFIREGNKYLESEIAPANGAGKAQFGRDTKFGYAISKVIKMNKKLQSEYQNDGQDIRIDFAMTDEKTKAVLLEANGGFKYTQDAMKLCNKKIMNLGFQEVEIQNYIVAKENVPANLNDTQKEVFMDFVIEQAQE